MQSNTVRALVVLSLLVVALAASFVEQRWLRAALVIVPALFLAQRALLQATPGAPTAPEQRSHPSSGGAAPQEERRSDLEVRRQVGTILELIRDLYSTCHMVSVGQLPAARAESKAQEVKEKLDVMTQEMMYGRAAEEGDPE